MSMEFKSPERGDPSEYFSRTLGRLGQFTDESLLEAGELGVEIIKDHTLSGISCNGSSFAPYNERYAKWKGSEHVDLKLHGGMLGALIARVDGGRLKIGVTGGEEALKARIHNEGNFSTVRSYSRGGRSIASYRRRKQVFGRTGPRPKYSAGTPARPFLGFNSSDLARMGEILIARMKERVRGE